MEEMNNGDIGHVEIARHVCLRVHMCTPGEGGRTSARRAAISRTRACAEAAVYVAAEKSSWARRSVTRFKARWLVCSERSSAFPHVGAARLTRACAGEDACERERELATEGVSFYPRRPEQC